MLGIAIAIGAVLLLVVLLLIFRLHSLMNVVKGSDQKAGSGVNKTNAVLLLVFLIVGLLVFGWYSVKTFHIYQQPIGSDHGVTTDRLFWITMAVTGLVFIITQVLLFYFSYRYRHNPERKALFFPENNKLEIIWTFVPAFVLTILVVYGLLVWNKVMAPAPEESEVVEIMGYQFAWKVRYPGRDDRLGSYDFRLIDVTNQFGMDFSDRASFDDFTPMELHLPKGKPVELRIRSRDVLHSVYAPHFRLKMDAVPGMPTRFWFIPTKTTAEMRVETGNENFNYEIACAEVCGQGHFSMRLIVVVEEPEEYEQWKESQKPWLSKNPEYISKVPENLRELAMTIANIDRDNTGQSNTVY
jgi:cytochrome c oxidase subunit 2